MPTSELNNARNSIINILVVDDEPIVGKRLKKALVVNNYHVDICEDPKIAMDLIIKYKYDVIVTDLRMGEIDGIQLLDFIKVNSKNTKVILITAYATIEVASEAAIKGAFDIIAKPFTPKDLRDKIIKAIKKSH